jgi:hypothetical protein
MVGTNTTGFPTFTADDSDAQWGLFDVAGLRGNYFTYFVREDGSILYRGGNRPIRPHADTRGQYKYRRHETLLHIVPRRMR